MGSFGIDEIIRVVLGSGVFGWLAIVLGIVLTIVGAVLLAIPRRSRDALAGGAQREAPRPA